MKFENNEQAYEFLKQLGAPPRLIRHVRLVGEAADLLIQKLNQMNVDFDEKFIRLGVAFHDTGKIRAFRNPVSFCDNMNIPLCNQ